MENKRGQFYLIAAMIIVAVIIGFAAIQNVAKKKESVKIYDLGEELGIESEQVIEHGLVSETYSVKEILEDFTEKYSDYAEGSFYFIFGNVDEISVATYRELVRGDVSINICSEFTSVPVTDYEYNIEEYPPMIVGDIITVEIGDIEHNFELKPGENFYYIISQQVGGEEYTITNK